MSKGYVFYAKGNSYVKQACLAAVSLKINSEIPISIITNSRVPKKYKSIFDFVIKPSWIEHDNSRYDVLNRWKIYHNSPYDETIVLDTDILVLSQLDAWWNFFQNYNLFYLSKVFTYRSTLITNDYYRKSFTYNNLPNLYNGLHYFKKSPSSQDFFTWVELISKNWELFYGQYCKEFYPKQPSMDLTCAIASKILNNDMEITNRKVDFLKFVHMKPYVQDWQSVKDNWQDKVPVYLTNDLKLYIGNYLQDGIIHYVNNDFATESIVSTYEKYLGI